MRRSRMRCVRLSRNTSQSNKGSQQSPENSGANLLLGIHRYRDERLLIRFAHPRLKSWAEARDFLDDAAEICAKIRDTFARHLSRYKGHATPPVHPQPY